MGWGPYESDILSPDALARDIVTDYLGDCPRVARVDSVPISSLESPKGGILVE